MSMSSVLGLMRVREVVRLFSAVNRLITRSMSDIFTVYLLLKVLKH